MAEILPSDVLTLRAVKALADQFHADPRGILALMNSESGLQYRLGPVSGYYGLIMAHPQFVDGVLGGAGSWASIVKNGSAIEQLAAIKKIWESSAKQFLGEPVAARAKKLGVRGDTVLYSLNFVPAYFAKMKSRTEPMVIRNGGPDGGVFYHDNPGFDLDGKGYITVLDIQKRLDRMMEAGKKNSRTAPLFEHVPTGSVFGTIAGVGVAAGVGAFAVWGIDYLIERYGKTA